MASMGSFLAGVDGSILVQSGSHHRPLNSFLSYRVMKTGGVAECNSSGFSSNLAVDLFSGCGGRRRRRMREVKAAAERDEADDDMDEALQANIDKSKKVLAMQKDLLQQIAERKKLVSSSMD